jgi:hypothetical protein
MIKYIKNIIAVLACANSLCLMAAGGTTMNPDVKWALKNSRNEYLYIDSINGRPAHYATVLFDNNTRSLPSQPLMLIKNGKVAEFKRMTGKKLDVNTVAVCALWGTEDKLKQMFKVGDTAELVAAPPFLPCTFTFKAIKNKAFAKFTPVLLTPEFGAKTPNSIFRQQAIIKNDRVSDYAGGNALIPRNGFVISGWASGWKHGGAHQVINWCGIGCKVSYDDASQMVTVTRDEKTWLLRAQYDIKQAAGFLKRNQRELSANDVFKVKTFLTSARRDYKNCNIMLARKEKNAAWDYLKSSLKHSEQAMIAACLPLKKDSFRSVAYCGARNFVVNGRVKAAGFNVAVLHYPATGAKESLRQNAIDLRKNGTDVWLWSWLPTSFPLTDAILNKFLPDLLANGKPVAKSYGGKHSGFVDLADPAARKAVITEAVKVCKELKLSGIMFDYERNQAGFGKKSVVEFCHVNNISPAEFNPKKMDKKQKELWNKFRSEQMGKFVAEACKELHKNGIKTGIWAAARGYNDMSATNEGSSDNPGPAVWLSWLKHFDVVSFMMYGQDLNWLNQRAKALFPLIKRQNPQIKIDAILIFWPEIASWFSMVPLENLLAQSDVMIRNGADGVSFFMAGNLDETAKVQFYSFFKALRDGIYRRCISD